MFAKLREHRDKEAEIVAGAILALMNLKIIPEWSLSYADVHAFLMEHTKIRVSNL